MRYYYKRPGDWLSKSLDTPSIAKSAAGHRLGSDWRYRIEGDSTDRTLAELIEMDRITHDRADSSPTDPSLLGPDATNPATSERVIFVLAAVVLVIKFFSALMPVSESPSPALNALNIAMELLAVIALIGLGVRLLGSQTSGRGKWVLVLVVGIVAALGILFIRLSGGPRMVLPPRSSDSSTHLEGLPKRVHELLDSHTQLAQSLLATRYAQEIKKAPAQRSLARRDVRDARQTVGQLRDCVGQILKLLAQAKLDGINLSPAFASNEQVLIRPEVWRAQQQAYTLSYEELGVVDQNWDDWVGKPFPENESELKPWQREVNQIDTEISAAKQQVQALIDQSKGR